MSARNMINKATWVFPILGFLALTMSAGADALRITGIGVYPTSVEFEGAVRGNDYFRTIGVISAGDTVQTFAFEAVGDMAPWISFVDMNDRSQEITEVRVNPRQEESVLLKVAIPSDTPNGAYTGSVHVSGTASDPADSSGAEGAGSSVNLGAEILVTAEVGGEQVVDGSYSGLTTAGQVELGSPVRLKATVLNAGNVQVQPQVRLDITDPEERAIARQAFLAEPIYPGERKEVEVVWDTHGLSTGHLVAFVGVRFGDKDLGTRSTAFDLVPFGTLTRQGALHSIAIPDPVIVVGKLVRVEATFINTGQIDTQAKLVGELLKDSGLSDVLSGEDRLVPVGASSKVEAFFRPAEPGEFTLAAKVNYEGKETDVRELQITVASTEEEQPASVSQNTDGPSQPFPFGWAALVAATTLLVVGSAGTGFVMLRRRHPGAPGPKAAAP